MLGLACELQGLLLELFQIACEGPMIVTNLNVELMRCIYLWQEGIEIKRVVVFVNSLYPKTNLPSTVFTIGWTESASMHSQFAITDLRKISFERNE